MLYKILVDKIAVKDFATTEPLTPPQAALWISDFALSRKISSKGVTICKSSHNHLLKNQGYLK